MDNILLVLLVVLLGGAGLISIFAIINLILPTLVDRARLAVELSPGRSLLLGLANSLLAVLLIGLFSIPMRAGGVLGGIFAFLAGLTILVIVALMLLGLVAATSLLGGRLGTPTTLMKTQMRGGLLLILACLTPFLGWWVFTPLVLWTALGAAIQTVFRRGPVMVLESTGPSAGD